jgi:outer membrane lipoprotein-sorting protein
MNNDCEKMKDQIADLVSGILSEAPEQKLQQHLVECPVCREYARALKNEDVSLTKFVSDIGTDMIHRQERLLQTIDCFDPSKENEILSIPKIAAKSPITKYAAAAVVAIAVILSAILLQQTATPVWAIEQTMEAIEGFQAIYGSGITVDEDGNEFEFEYWARPRKDGTASGDLRMETKGGYIIVVNEQKNITYKYDPQLNILSVEKGITFYSRPWINGEYFRKMKKGCTEWHEEYRKDELTGRECVFVKASDRDPGNNWSYNFQFDVQTKLPVCGKVWSNSDFKGKPYVTANEIVYNPVLPEGIFDFTIPEGVEVIRR